MLQKKKRKLLPSFPSQNWIVEIQPDFSPLVSNSKVWKSDLKSSGHPWRTRNYRSRHKEHHAVDPNQENISKKQYGNPLPYIYHACRGGFCVSFWYSEARLPVVQWWLLLLFDLKTFLRVRRSFLKAFSGVHEWHQQRFFFCHSIFRSESSVLRGTPKFLTSPDDSNVRRRV